MFSDFSMCGNMSEHAGVQFQAAHGIKKTM